jgi:hypothetical protein
MRATGSKEHEVDMPRINCYVTADRLRLIGGTLSNSADQEVVKAYAKELETLTRREVLPPTPIRMNCNTDEVGLGIFAEILKKAFPVNACTAFDDFFIGALS